MKQQIPFRITLMILAIFIITSCSSTRHASRSQIQDQHTRANSSKIVNPTAVNSVSTVSPNQPNLTLMDYLKRVPGVQISGNMVLVRGMNSITQGHEPLYVIDNAPVGNSYAQAAGAVDMNDIKTVSVLRDVASTTQYGMRGSNGVIVIITKKGN